MQRPGGQFGAAVFDPASGAYPTPLMLMSPEAVITRSMVISARVRVPVLSEQMTEAEPSVSTDDRFLTDRKSTRLNSSHG